MIDPGRDRCPPHADGRRPVSRPASSVGAPPNCIAPYPDRLTRHRPSSNVDIATAVRLEPAWRSSPSTSEPFTVSPTRNLLRDRHRSGTVPRPPVRGSTTAQGCGQAGERSSPDPGDLREERATASPVTSREPKVDDDPIGKRADAAGLETAACGGRTPLSYLVKIACRFRSSSAGRREQTGNAEHQ